MFFDLFSVNFLFAFAPTLGFIKASMNLNRRKAGAKRGGSSAASSRGTSHAIDSGAERPLGRLSSCRADCVDKTLLRGQLRALCSGRNRRGALRGGRRLVGSGRGAL